MKLFGIILCILGLIVGIIFGAQFIASKKNVTGAEKELRAMYLQRASYMNQVQYKIDKDLAAGMSKKELKKKMIKSGWKPAMIDLMLKGK